MLFCLHRKLKSNSVTIHKNLIVGIFIAELTFLVGINRTEDQVIKPLRLSCFVLLFVLLLGDTVAYWSAHSTLNRAVRVRALLGVICVVFLGKTLYSHSASPPRCMNGYWKIYCWG